MRFIKGENRSSALKVNMILYSHDRCESRADEISPHSSIAMMMDLGLVFNLNQR